MGRLGDGRVVFVPGAFAGEQVKAEIVAEKRTWVRARLIEVVEPSPERIGSGAAPAPGMVYHNLSSRGETAAKSLQLAEALRIDSAKVQHIACGDELNYRNKVTYHFARQGKSWAIGYLEERTHNVVDVVSDPLARPEINAALPAIRQKTIMLLTQGASAVRDAVARKGSLTIRWSRISGVKWWLGDADKDCIIRESTLGKTFEVPADGFWQMNSIVGERLVREVVDEYSRDAAQSPNLIDLYCGVGVFGICAAPVRLTGVESGRRAVEFARKNAAANGIQDATFIAQETCRTLRRLGIDSKTAVILDPPRGGLERGVADFLARSRARKILYVSCDPATLARDLKTLYRTFELKSVKWLNMFPRTARFESFVTLTRR